MSALLQPVTGSDHVEGDPGALISLVLYSDFQCPFCANAYPAVARLLTMFGDDLCFVHRNFPLPHLHPHALRAALLAEHAATFGRFQEVCTLLYRHQTRFGPALFDAVGQQLGLPADGARKALERGTYLARIERDVSAGLQSGVRGTPTFFINALRYRGNNDARALQAAIEALRRDLQSAQQVPQWEYPPQAVPRQRHHKAP